MPNPKGTPQERPSESLEDSIGWVEDKLADFNKTFGGFKNMDSWYTPVLHHLRAYQRMLELEAVSGNSTTGEAEEPQGEDGFVCESHGKFNPTHQWGCPDCLRELRHEAEVYKARWLWLAYKDCAMWVDSSGERPRYSAADTDHFYDSPEDAVDAELKAQLTKATALAAESARRLEDE